MITIQYFPTLSNKVRLFFADSQMAFLPPWIFRRLVAELAGGGSTPTSLEEDAPKAQGTAGGDGDNLGG